MFAFSARVKGSKRQFGFASIEMIAAFPVFVMLIMGVIDVTNIIQANYVVVSISREASNIVSRSSTETPEQIMDTVSKTSGTLDLTQDGAMYITLVRGAEDSSPYVDAQYQWLDSGVTVFSKTWSGCTSWGSDGKCLFDEDNPPSLNDFPIGLSDDESTYVVEVFYQYEPFYSLLFGESITFSDTTYM
ncbi:pilus assembly protein [Vibrio vulnificus]|uniref:TadE/TadG family type IV pilus assembly protein n=1 Tax=Vibrio vulnificus TaxID=672 RepID=UPI001D7CD406|nr:TadE family protein [Vibrio vulnificus]EGR0669018.1 pilus assembly protein [Vibrio vulnificus]EGR1510333.1 pilus assembly protein [Vibrio vulnificus]EJV0367431.1 pilus assembly protein [Vibrio vulnificus]EMB7842846.1 pilus assembly protein [Vibrio vulnificus]MCG6261519.1 pilus assembly protein [Vibrio vulnificus]